MGIHNEAGHAHVSPIPPLRELISSLLDFLTSTTDPERSFLPFGASGPGKDEVVLLTNNLGGLSELEISGIAREAVSQLRGRGITVQRLLVGPFMVRILSSIVFPRLSRQIFADFSQHAWFFVDVAATSTFWRIGIPIRI